MPKKVEAQMLVPLVHGDFVHPFAHQSTWVSGIKAMTKGTCGTIYGISIVYGYDIGILTCNNRKCIHINDVLIPKAAERRIALNQLNMC